MTASVDLWVVVEELGEELDEPPDGTLEEVEEFEDVEDDPFCWTKYWSARGAVVLLPKYVTTSLCSPKGNCPVPNNIWL